MTSVERLAEIKAELLHMCEAEFGWEIDRFIEVTREVVPTLFAALSAAEARVETLQRQRDELLSVEAIERAASAMEERLRVYPLQNSGGSIGWGASPYELAQVALAAAVPVDQHDWKLQPLGPSSAVGGEPIPPLTRRRPAVPGMPQPTEEER